MVETKLPQHVFGVGCGRGRWLQSVGEFNDYPWSRLMIKSGRDERVGVRGRLAGAGAGVMYASVSPRVPG